MMPYQLALPLIISPSKKDYYARLDFLLHQDLDFHDQDSSYGSHGMHAFPAKFPPQLPRFFINNLTDKGDIVLDPMQGSGTTILEAYLAGRRGVGIDIDPLALQISEVKTKFVDPCLTTEIGGRIVRNAKSQINNNYSDLIDILENRWDDKTLEFIDYWFAKSTQVELLALITEIEKIEDNNIREFFELAFSAIIITKSGGVSLALDLAHTRPHRAKVILSEGGEILEGRDRINNPTKRTPYVTKTLRSPIKEFRRRIKHNLEALSPNDFNSLAPWNVLGNAQKLPWNSNSVDLIVTSPPYASNAIDYMRAHKFSLIWFGYTIDDLSNKRKDYIGGETTKDFPFESLPDLPSKIVSKISALDENKGLVLHRYYSEMSRVLREMFRVLKTHKAAIVVVGSSNMRGIDTMTGECLAEIGKSIGFKVPNLGMRILDRNKRMLPAGTKVDPDSQIQQRMHQEFVIGFYKPHE